ncbi:MAG: histidine ammonia-lyase [Phycisphaerales bacterium]
MKPEASSSSSTTTTVFLDGSPLTLADVERVARAGHRVELQANALAHLDRVRQAVETHADGKTSVYGINTGFGSLSRVRIQPHQVVEVQRNLIRSHAAGVGSYLEDDVVRAMLLILAASLMRGHSGVRSQLVQRIADLLNSPLVPCVPSRGSVGASGDLAPLAHAALVLIGEGFVFDRSRSEHPRNTPVATGDVFVEHGLRPIELAAKEGLALINGTHMMAAIAALALCDVDRIVSAGIASATLAIDACLGSDEPLDPRIHQVRGQHGQTSVATQMRELLAGSQMVSSHKDEDPRVQDPYCLRASPQVLGAVVDSLNQTRLIVERELAAVTDNPLVFCDDPADPASTSFLTGANFHGMPLAIAIDHLKIALVHLAGIAERRINWLLTASDSENPVNLYLSPKPGLHSGMMIVQYTAAACCNELHTLAAPASIHNIPTSAGIEDYNSMGTTAAHQLRSSVGLCRSVIAMELLVMAEAIEYHRPMRSSPPLEALHAAIRKRVSRLTEDRSPAPDIAAIEQLIDHWAD